MPLYVFLLSFLLLKSKSSVSKMSIRVKDLAGFMERDVLAKMRTTYASERTALAWIRTGLTIVASVVVLMRLYGVCFRVQSLAIIPIGAGLLMVGYGIYRLYMSLRIERVIEKR